MHFTTCLQKLPPEEQKPMRRFYQELKILQADHRKRFDELLMKQFGCKPEGMIGSDKGEMTAQSWERAVIFRADGLPVQCSQPLFAS